MRSSNSVVAEEEGKKDTKTSRGRDLGEWLPLRTERERFTIKGKEKLTRTGQKL